MTALFALATSLLWGLADFGGGLLTRRMPALTVVVVSQSIAAVVLGAIVLATGAWSEAGPQLWFAVAAGLVGPVAMLAFYKALALGPMGVVSPLASLSIAVPVAVGLVLGERPGLLQFAGIAVAVVGVVLAGGPQFRGAPVQRQAVLLTLVAAFGFGAVMALIAEASSTLTGLFLALFVQRVTNVATGGTALYVAVRRGSVAPPRRSRWESLPGPGVRRPRRRRRQRHVLPGRPARPGHRGRRPRLALPGGDGPRRARLPQRAAARRSRRRARAWRWWARSCSPRAEPPPGLGPEGSRPARPVRTRLVRPRGRPRRPAARRCSPRPAPPARAAAPG